MPLGGNHPIASLLQVQANLLVRGTAWMDFEIYKKILKQEVWCSRVVCLCKCVLWFKTKFLMFTPTNSWNRKYGRSDCDSMAKKSGCFLRGSSLSKYYFQPVDLVINFLISCFYTPKSERDSLLKIYRGANNHSVLFDDTKLGLFTVVANRVNP